MTAPAKLALALWTVLALAVFSVTFDHQTRLAGFAFIADQAQRQIQGLPLDTIENGFRPLVRAAAMQSAAWLVLILAAGTSAVWLATRRQARNAF
jgi:hypothetical protein